MAPTKRTARIAGLFYLLVVLTGLFVLIYVPGKLFVAGDASATASNILAHESLFRSYIVVGLVSELCFIAVVLVLFQLLKGVSQELSAVMVILVLIDAPMAFLGIANEAATLAFVRGPGFMAAFDKPQSDALATLLINVNSQGRARLRDILGAVAASSRAAGVSFGLSPSPLGPLAVRQRPGLLGDQRNRTDAPALPESGLNDLDPRPLRRGGFHAVAAHRRCESTALEQASHAVGTA